MIESLCQIKIIYIPMLNMPVGLVMARFTGLFYLYTQCTLGSLCVYFLASTVHRTLQPTQSFIFYLLPLSFMTSHKVINYYYYVQTKFSNSLNANLHYPKSMALDSLLQIKLCILESYWQKTEVFYLSECEVYR